jgi:hypothetical protein
MRWFSGMACLSGLVLATVFAVDVQAAPKPVKIINQWKGSVADEALQKMAPECITTEKALEKLWKTWKIEGKMPKIDFTKEIVVIATTSGSRLNLSARLHEDGNLEVVGFGTRDLVPGFRYIIGTVSAEGVKTVNKKELPKE